MEMGAISPPVGMNLFVIYKTARDVPLHTIYRGAIPYIAVQWVMCFLIAAFPAIVTFVPEMLSIA